MSTGLKKELGLGEPRPQVQGSTKQADDFKAAYQAAAGPINECLQYTAAHAEQAKHDPQAGKRDTSCQAYQAALSRIDPTNPSVAQGAIDQVLAAVQGLKSGIESFKTAAEKAFNDWQAKEPELHSATDKIREMVDWGHEKATALQQIIEGCVAKEKERAYEGAKTILDQLCGKLGPIYEEYQKQKAAKEEYDALAGELAGRMPTQCEADYPSLEPLQTELTTIEGQMKAAADTKDYVKALEHARNLRTKLDEYEKKKKELEEKKAAYEKLAQELAGRMPTQCEADYPSLDPLQTELTTIEGQMKAAADTKDWDKATEHANSLKTKLDEYEKKKKELEEKKAAYEKLAQELAGRMPTQCEADYPSLDPLQTELTTIEGQMKAAADTKDWDKATEHANSLKTKLDEYEKKKKELEEKKAAYEKVAGEIAGRMPTQCEAGYPSLGPLQTELVSIEGQMKAAADAKEYDKALEHANNLKTKIDAYEKAKKDLEAKYQQALKDAEAQVAKMNSHAQKAHYAAEITAAAGQVTAAKAKGDSGAIEDAITALKQASSACFKVITQMDMLDKGLDKARAEEVADVSQSLVDSGVDQEKALEVGQIMNKGGSGDIKDAKVVAAQVAELPIDVIKDLRAKGTKVVACRDNITDYRADLKGQKPQGWKPGSKWDTVPGVYLGGENENEVVIATRGHDTGNVEVPKKGNGHGSYDLTTHETMHAYDHTDSPEKHEDADFKKAWKGDKSKLGAYYTQPDGAGESEAFAESAARYYAGDPKLKTEWPNLHKYWEEVEKKKKNP